ncbi:MAG: threonine synthase [Actinomycetota bacterium]
MPKIAELRCRECARHYAAAAVHVCEFCFGPLEPVYDFEAITRSVSREKIAAGPPTIWRYSDLLPVDDDAERVDIGAGLTPLLRAGSLGRELGIDELYLKNDSANPTHSFKDRVVSVALTVARAMGFDTVACASTGNLANAVAAHAAKAGLQSYVFIPSDLEVAKVINTAVFGGHIVSVEGNYDAVNRLCSEVAQAFPWAFVNVNIRPFYAEGSKTLAFEIAEQLGWRAPADIVVPVASGSLLTKVRKGLSEMVLTGLIDESPTRIHAAQAAGCNPVVRAIQTGADHIRPVKPDTIAKSLAIGDPADGYYALKTVRDTGGGAADVTESEIIDGIKLLARTEGIFTETAGGVTISALKKLADTDQLSKTGPVVALITGMGLKTAEVLGEMKPTMVIPPDFDAFQKRMRRP